MLKRVVAFFATFGGLGYSPFIPGTVGTLGAIPLVYLLMKMNPIWYMVFTLIFALGAIFICQLYENSSDKHDSSEIVIDEVAGFMVTMTWLPITWQSFLCGFVVFRLLDIVKPFPIGYVDKKIGGGVGVVADDLLAGLAGNIILQMIFVNTNWLGVQYNQAAAFFK